MHFKSADNFAQITFKQIEQESPAWSGFEARATKPNQQRPSR